MSDTLKKLEELTPRLPALFPENPEPMVVYQGTGGDALGFRVFIGPNVAVQRVFMPRGMRFNEHCHEESELLVVYHGALRIHMKDKEFDLSKGDGYCFPPLTTHAATATEDTWVMCVSVPAGEGYP